MSSPEDNRLLTAKDRLCECLGDSSTKIYLSYLKLWFRKVWTKEQFDMECRKLFTMEQRHLHNEFFLAILNKITLPMQSDSSPKSVAGRKRKRRTGSERSVFEPVDLYDYLPEESEEARPPTNTPLHQPRFAVEELFLPDTSLILGRLLVVAWENGLTTADDDISEMLVLGVQKLLKNLLTAVIIARKDYRTTGSGGFFYDVGCEYKNPYTQNTATRQTIDDFPFEVDREVSSTSLMHRMNDDSFYLSACETNHQTPVNGRITMKHLHIALQDKNLIPVHSVYANNMERITQLLG
ncbi:transcriptional adapter 1-like [Contarinia nasturtii]|uniref:transcriptional adapter 1-like n=1 Tax=Contarinia nasturtii TaxID=265458 RepID=UPI0012D3ECEA|nr:transcriptional adapter 1-like [Contarinia nasturtii]